MNAQASASTYQFPGDVKKDGFQKIHECQVILSRDGVYTPCDLYKLDGEVFARLRGTFIRLYSGGRTSTRHVVHKLIGNVPFAPDRHGRLTMTY